LLGMDWVAADGRVVGGPRTGGIPKVSRNSSHDGIAQAIGSALPNLFSLPNENWRFQRNTCP